MKKQASVRLLIVAVIIFAAFFVMAVTRASTVGNTKEDCTVDKSCEQNTQSEFILESLTRNLLSR